MPPKLVFKPMKDVPQLPPDFVPEKMTIIGHALDAIFAHGASAPVSCERVYSSVRDLCRCGQEKAIYDKFVACCDAHIVASFERLIYACHAEPRTVVRLAVATW